MADLESELARFEAEIKAASTAPVLAPPLARPPQATSLPPPPARPPNGYAPHASAGPSSAPHISLPPPPQYAMQQPAYPQQQAAPQHQVPYPSQPMYPHTAPAYPAYPPAAPAPSYYVAPAHAYAQPQMHEPPAQAPQSAAQAAMMAAIKADVESQGKIGKAGKPKVDKANAVYRSAAGQKWWDATLTEWPEHDFRIFVGDMGNEVNDDILTKAFTKYASFQKARIVRDKHSNKSKGYGFVSFSDAVEGAKALREMNGKYIGNRPCKLRKSTWEERTPNNAYKGKRKATDNAGSQPKKAGIFHK